MNSACIIAACAANARARKKEEPVHIPTEDIYYKVTLRKYYRFDPMSLANFITQVCEHVEPNTSIAQMPINVVNIEARSSAVQQSFSVRASKCPNGIDNYIKENLAQITSSTDWLELDKQVLADYIKWADTVYGVKMPADAILYTTEYYWEVN